MLTMRDVPHHSVMVRYIDSRRQIKGYDLFFISDRHQRIVPKHGCYVAGLPFPGDASWLLFASRFLSKKPRDYGRGWFRWDEPIRTPKDIPCRSISSRMIDVILR